MFDGFFYVCRAKGLEISMGEWLTLQEALTKGLAGSSLTQFFYLARGILAKSETEYDKFENAFEEYFREIASEDGLSAQLRRWLDTSQLEEWLEPEDEKEKRKGFRFDQEETADVDREQVREEYENRLRGQDGKHNGGCQWIGTVGKTSFGNLGNHAGGIRVGGKTGNQSAFAVIGEKKYRDFRDDRVLDNRQFQLALRLLRQFSSGLDVPETELDLQGTVDQTCNRGGMLKLVMEKPRKNTVKLLLLFDSGGTMIPYSALMNELFQSVHRSRHFKDVKCYYFHNCVYSKLYKTPECENGDWVDTDWVFRNLDEDYRVILVGDAAMAPEELYAPDGNYRGPNGGLSGWEWLNLLKLHYKKIIWLNPKMAVGKAPWREAETAVGELFPMYRLTAGGLREGMRCLMGKA